MVIKTFSSAVEGFQGAKVQIEAISLNALPNIYMTGLPGEVVKESRERVIACLVNLGFDIPTSKILVHLSPANIKKTGSHYDLAIALAVLSAESRMLQCNLSKTGFLGELSLDGTLRPVRGALPLIEVLVADPTIQIVIIPRGNAREGSILKNEKIRVADTIGQVLLFLREQNTLETCPDLAYQAAKFENNIFDQVRGQTIAKRAVQIALAGRHHLLLVGKPGVGKSMISSAAVELLPPLCHEEFIEVMKVYSSSAVETDSFIETKQRPYRSPHHTISSSALLGGGGGTLWPGEISLAHHGVLFLDEFPEFRRDAIEGLREPLQSGVLHLNRIGKSASFPARMTLIAAMNPCPCGMLSTRDNRCRCSPEKKAQYRKKLSTPILDRIGLMVNMSEQNLGLERPSDIDFSTVRDSIEYAFEKQAHRYKNLPGIFGNGMVPNCRSLEDFHIDHRSEDWIKVKQKEFGLSLRRIGQLINIARTIADVERKENITLDHVLESWGLRCFDFYQPS